MLLYIMVNNFWYQSNYSVLECILGNKNTYIPIILMSKKCICPHLYRHCGVDAMVEVQVCRVVVGTPSNPEVTVSHPTIQLLLHAGFLKVQIYRVFYTSR